MSLAVSKPPLILGPIIIIVWDLRGREAEGGEFVVAGWRVEKKHDNP
jgi:hypothetical protein